MALQIREGYRSIPAPLVYTKEGPITGWPSFNNEMDNLQIVMAENDEKMKRAIKALQNTHQDIFDREGNYKKQLSHQHLEYEGIRADLGERGIKSYVTDITFQINTSGAAAGDMLRWGQNANPVANSIIYWPDYAFTNLIPFGNFIDAGAPPSFGIPHYAYIDPRNNNYTVTVTQVPIDAMRDGRIILCIAYGGVGGYLGNTTWRRTIYGGGLHPKQ